MKKNEEKAEVAVTSDVSKPTYTVEEFAAASKKLFKTSPDVVVAAFKHARVTEATKEKGIELVMKYLNQPA